MSDDYLLKVKIQNNKIISLMRAKGIESIAELARASGMHQQELGKPVNMVKSPLLSTNFNEDKHTDKPWAKSVLKLADFFGVLPDEMFNEQQLYHELKTNRSETAISQESLQQFMLQLDALEPEQLYLEDQKNTLLNDAIENLNPKLKTIISMRYGFNDNDPMTLEEIASECGLTRERVRQLLHEAYRAIKRTKPELEELDEHDVGFSQNILFALTAEQRELIENSENPLQTAREHKMHMPSVIRHLKDTKKYLNLSPSESYEFDKLLRGC
jgi:RNA polymerase sigma factor (sigma-70 family)